jgi:hypothetical protein
MDQVHAHFIMVHRRVQVINTFASASIVKTLHASHAHFQIPGPFRYGLAKKTILSRWSNSIFSSPLVRATLR